MSVIYLFPSIKDFDGGRYGGDPFSTFLLQPFVPTPILVLGEYVSR